MIDLNDPLFWHWATGGTFWLIGAVYRWRYLFGSRDFTPRQALMRSVFWPVYVKRCVGRWLYRVALKPVVTNQWQKKPDPESDVYGDVPLPPVGSRIPMPPVKAPKSDSPEPPPPEPPPTRIIREDVTIRRTDASDQ